MNNKASRIDNLVRVAHEGRLSKATLAESLTEEAGSLFLSKCAAIEHRFTEACTAKQDPCLESGCAMEGDVCLNALLRSTTEYQKACAAEWDAFFSDSANRSEPWTVASRKRQLLFCL